ncbi:hypothetical protein Catovirus_1_178 [Catovirus CTV1]|uniref:Uncharacterized protein n=1 Tax=Catovirus CTV1 TaxID=1977631 RepID=A0A1V0S910_9VIRU|nr:hypothetical protein Catovirus_1_178 [Catovirus CTV1]
MIYGLENQRNSIEKVCWMTQYIIKNSNNKRTKKGEILCLCIMRDSIQWIDQIEDVFDRKDFDDQSDNVFCYGNRETVKFFLSKGCDVYKNSRKYAPYFSYEDYLLCNEEISDDKPKVSEKKRAMYRKGAFLHNIITILNNAYETIERVLLEKQLKSITNISYHDEVSNNIKCLPFTQNIVYSFLEGYNFDVLDNHHKTIVLDCVMLIGNLEKAVQLHSMFRQYNGRYKHILETRKKKYW